jgi:hypothetical protein
MNCSCPNYTAPLTLVLTTLTRSVSLGARMLATVRFFLPFQSVTGNTLTRMFPGDRRSLSKQCSASPCTPDMCVHYTGLSLTRLFPIGVDRKSLTLITRPTRSMKMRHFMCPKMVIKLHAYSSTYPNVAAEPLWKIFQSFTNITHVDLCWVR